MDIKKTFELYTGLYAVQISTFSNSFAHTNYLITSNLAQDFIMSIPHPKVELKQLFNQEYKVIKLMLDKKFDNTTIFFDKDLGTKITKYIGDVASQNDIVDNYILFIKSLKSFHNLDYSNYDIREVSPIQFYHYLRNKVDKIDLDSTIEEKIISKASLVYEECQNKVLCHNNLSLHNIIKGDNKYLFTGNQLVSISDPLYDLANFFFKSKITNKPVMEKFLKRYFGNQYQEEHYEKVKIYLLMAKLIYATWNTYLYSVTETNYEKKKADKLFAQLNETKFFDE